MKKTPRKKLIKKLDDLTRELVKERDQYQCQWCEKYVSGHNCQWSHVITRSEHLLRWNKDNSMVLCYHCHKRWHSNPIESVEWFKKKFPDRYKKIIKLSKASRPIPIDELQSYLDELQNGVNTQ